MIELYMAITPNNQKVQILLEELGTPYNTHMIDLKANQQKSPEFLAINPNGKTPAMIDTEADFGRATPIFESGAMLVYLAEKSRHFLGSNEYEKAQTMSWLMFQMSGVGPIFGNYGYAISNKIPLMATRFEVEGKRVLGVMNTQLGKHAYIAGDFYSIADMSIYPWMAYYMKSKPEWFEATPHVRRWVQQIAERPAVKKVMPK